MAFLGSAQGRNLTTIYVRSGQAMKVVKQVNGEYVTKKQVDKKISMVLIVPQPSP